jgi:hypothetical protein
MVLAGGTAVYMLSVKEAARFALLSWASPVKLVARAMGEDNPALATSALLLLNLLCFAAAWWSFRYSLVNPPKSGSQRRIDSRLFGLPGAAGGLIAKDLRYFPKLLDPYFGLLVSALCCFYLLSSDAPSVPLTGIFIVIVFIPNAPLAFNSFGLDTRSGLNRYALLPASGATIMQGKNIAYAIMASIQVSPIILLSSWRLGLWASAFGLVEAAALSAAYLAWGNWMSIAFATKMHFFRLAPASGSLPEIIAGVVFGSLPGVALVYVLRIKTEWATSVALLILLVYGIVYWLTITRCGRRFEQQREKMVSLIS